MRLLEYSHDFPTQIDQNPFHIKGTLTPPQHRDTALDAYISAVERDILNLTTKPVRDNLTTRERHALKQLHRRTDIIIKAADKGSGTVVMDRDWYINECLRQLNDTKFYRRLDTDITSDIQTRVEFYIKRLHTDGFIDYKTKQFLIQTDPKPAIPFKLALRLRRICSSDESFTLRANELIQYLNDLGYNLSFLKREIQRVHAITRNETLKPSLPTTNQPSRVPLVITYNPALRSVSSIIQRHFKILSSSPRCNNVFQTTPLVAFRRTDNLSDILVRSKLRTDKQTNVTMGSFRCGKNCITCRYITDGRTNYTFSATATATATATALTQCRKEVIECKKKVIKQAFWLVNEQRSSQLANQIFCFQIKRAPWMAQLWRNFSWLCDN